MSPSLSIAGTMPQVETVTRLFERPNPKSSSRISAAVTVFCRLRRGSPIPIITTFDIALSSVLLEKPRTLTARHTWPTISAAERFLLNPWRPVEQNLQPMGHPTWVEMQSVALSSSGI